MVTIEKSPLFTELSADESEAISGGADIFLLHKDGTYTRIPAPGEDKFYVQKA